mmetsp:Transcript_19207/g.18346  ORF Transcript_19207/g.18346 Transcript_19207/m.18346 type:complete len:90 (-) Transcript_19207:716-985(-)
MDPSRIGIGLVGIKNISNFCYMNACLQCLLPIDELKDYFLRQEYAKYQNVITLSDDFAFCNTFYLFYKAVFLQSQIIIDPIELRTLVTK